MCGAWAGSICTAPIIIIVETTGSVITNWVLLARLLFFIIINKITFLYTAGKMRNLLDSSEVS